jgi:hypothetical protein
MGNIIPRMIYTYLIYECINREIKGRNQHGPFVFSAAPITYDENNKLPHRWSIVH